MANPLDNLISQAVNNIKSVAQQRLGQAGGFINQGLQQTFAPQIKGAQTIYNYANKGVTTGNFDVLPQSKAKGFVPQAYNIGRDIVNYPANALGNAANELGANLGHAATNTPVIPYTQLKSPLSRLGYQLGNLTPVQAPQMNGVPQTANEYIGNTAEAALLPLSFYGGGAVKTIGKNAIEQGVKAGVGAAIKQGFSQGAKLGGIYGALQGLSDGRKDELGKQFALAVVNAGGGALAGGLLGGGIGGLGGVMGTALGLIQGKLKLIVGASDDEVDKLAQNFLRDELGRFAGKKKTGGEPQYYGDLRQSLGLPRNGNYQEGYVRLPGKPSPTVDKKLKPMSMKNAAQEIDKEISNTPKPLVDPLNPTGNQVVTDEVLAQPSKPLLKAPGQQKQSVPPSSSSKRSIPTPEEVAQQLPQRLDSLMQKTAGYSTAAPTGGNRGSSLYTKTLREGQSQVTSAVEKGLSSESKLIRNASSTLVGFFKGLGQSPERAAATMDLRGGMSVSNQRSYDVMESLYKSLNSNKKALERVNAVLDPALAKNKVRYNQLTTQEKQVHDLIREGLDLVHDTSYANGFISPELYAMNRGKYVPRLYDVYELPIEVSQFVKQGKKIATDLYKSKGDINAWKKDNSLNDPVYALGKRLAQVETNQAIRKYTDYLASSSNLVSDVERAGFTKLSDSKAYGALAGKYVLNSAAEELKGTFFANQGMNALYDAFKAYDRMGIRQLQKKLLTVFNPTTNVGNITTDNVFGFLVGVDPLTLNKNILKLKQNPKEYKQISDYLMRKGISATDITRSDFTNKLSSVDTLAGGIGENKGVLAKLESGADKVQAFYGGTDDVYKASAFKSLLDQGKSLEEATRLVSDGFQNYSNVGKFYDLYAKTPIVGQAFIKFQGDLMRIIKNAAVNKPLSLIAFLGTLYGVSRLTSKVSGESDTDRVARETRFGAPTIPGLNIPLTWQTPYGELNVARYISPVYANNTGDEQGLGLARKSLPFVPDITTDSSGKVDIAKTIAKSSGDPLLGPLVQTIMDRDFRGKPISDPESTMYQPSTLTTEEKLRNQSGFITRAYLPPVPNTIIDLKDAAQGQPDRYNKTRSLPQAALRAAGIKIEQYGPQQVQEAAVREEKYNSSANKQINQNIKQIQEDLYDGKITPVQAQARINAQQGQLKTPQPLQGSGKTINYREKNGDFKSFDIGKIPTPASNTGNRVLDEQVREKSNSDVNAYINNVAGAYNDGQISQEEATQYINRAQSKLLLSKVAEPLTPPQLTGNVEFDKKLTSQYNSKLTSKINDVIKLVELGAITQQQAIDSVNALTVKKASTAKVKKPKKLKAIKLKPIKLKTKKIKFKKLKALRFQPVANSKSGL